MSPRGRRWLLHEAQHLLGHGEEMALRYVWLERPRLGWTDERYSRSRVWRNTREWTQQSAPALFVCGADGKSDCVE